MDALALKRGSLLMRKSGKSRRLYIFELPNEEDSARRTISCQSPKIIMCVLLMMMMMMMMTRSSH